MRRDAVDAAHFGVPLGSANEKSTSRTRCFKGNRQRPILPGRVQPSTFGTGELNFCVRYGNRWDLSVITTGKSLRPVLTFCYSASCLTSRDSTLSGCTLTTAQIRVQNADLTIDLFVSFLLFACFAFAPLASFKCLLFKRLNEAFDLLVSTTCMCYHTSSVDLSTW